MYYNLIALALVLALATGAQSSASLCRNAVVPPSMRRGVNQISRTSDTPIFQLHLKALRSEDGSNPTRTAYKVSISIQDGFPIQFTEASLAVSVANGSCGAGEFDFRPGDYNDIVQDHDEQCPRLLQTRRQQFMTELLPLVWVPPSCGCVQMRMLLLDSSQSYYAENSGIFSGSLAKTICIQKQTRKSKKITREHRFDSLCYVIDKHSSSEIISRSQFQSHRQLETHLMDHMGLEMAMELRRSDAMTCCSMILDVDKMQCFEDARRRRIDAFCQDGTPDIPFKSFRRHHMKQLEESCCFILGEYRYKCFAKNSKLASMGKDSSILDYSMDASDVVNDLADFGSHEYLDDMLRPANPDDENDDGDEDDEEYINEEDEDEEEEDIDTLDMDKLSEEIEVETDTDIEDVHGVGELNPDKTAITNIYTKPEIKKPLYARKMSSKKTSREKEGTLITILKKKSKTLRNSKESQRQLSSAERKRSSRRRQGGRRKGGNSKEGGRSRRNRRNRKTKRVESSAERRSRGNKSGRRPIKTEDLMPQSQYEFEDQGGKSSGRQTKRKLNRKFKRVQLRKMCCDAGVDTGVQVYGEIQQVKDECKHGGNKYTSKLKLGVKSYKKCTDLFVNCCSEEAKKGLTMTSQEFVESGMFHWGDTQKQIDLKMAHQVLSQRGRNQKPKNNRRSGSKMPIGTDIYQQTDYGTPQNLAVNSNLNDINLKQNPVSSELKNIALDEIPKNIKNNQEDVSKTNQKQKSKLISQPVDEADTDLRRKSTKRRNNRRRQNILPLAIGALDSKEMSERNTRKYQDALDSREMADQYRVRNNRKLRRNRMVADGGRRKQRKWWRSRFG